jgi:hypothetical protein
MNQKLQDEPFDEKVLPGATDVSMPYCDQVYSYTLTGDLGSGYTIESVGVSGPASRTVRGTLQLLSPFQYALLTKGTLTLKGGTTVSSYNSKDVTDTDTSAKIGSQSNEDSSVILNFGCTVNGDVFTSGNLDSAIKDLGATVTGSTYIKPPTPLPDVSAPTTLPDMGTDISAKGNTVTITPVDSGIYTEISLKSTGTPGILEISGGNVVLHVTGDIDLGNSAEIVVKTGSTLTIYTDADIQCDNGSSINVENPTKAADTLRIYATGNGDQFFDFKAKSEWVGAIYAPNAYIDLYAGGDIYGAIVGHEFDLKSGGNFKYDRGLETLNSVDDDGVQFAVSRFYDGPPSFTTSD